MDFTPEDMEAVRACLDGIDRNTPVTVEPSGFADAEHRAHQLTSWSYRHGQLSSYAWFSNVGSLPSRSG